MSVFEYLHAVINRGKIDWPESLTQANIYYVFLFIETR